MSSPAITQPTNRVPEFDTSDRARKARISAGLDQNQMQELTGISRTTITAIEHGRVQPRKSTMMLWAIATGVNFDWLMTGKVPDEGGNDEAPNSKESGASDESRLSESNRRPFHYE